MATGLSAATRARPNSSHEKAAPSRRPLSIATPASNSAQYSPSTNTRAFPRRSRTSVTSGKAPPNTESEAQLSAPTQIEEPAGRLKAPCRQGKTAVRACRCVGQGCSRGLLEHLARWLFGDFLGDLLRGFVEAELVVDVQQDALAHLLVILQELLGVLAALPEALLAVGEPGAALLHHVVLYPHVQQAALARDPLSVHHVELHRLERRRHLVLHHLDPGLVAHRVGADLKRPDAPDVQAHAGVELQRPPPGRRLRRSEHHPDLLPELVDEDGRGARTVQRTRKLPESLAHQASL